MLFISAEELTDLLDYESLVAALHKAFQLDFTAPNRHHHHYPTTSAEKTATLLLMPAWSRGSFLGVKVVTVSPDNDRYHLPTVQGTYLLFDTNNGQLLAYMDGPALTARRTAAASALAASFLASNNSNTLLVIGTGTLAPELVKAHASVRPLRQIYIWGRNMDKATRLAQQLQDPQYQVYPIKRIEDKVTEADIISCATLSKIPLVKGGWLRPGQHIDLVGSYLPDHREADDEVIKKSTIFADNRETASRESGDLWIPIQRGILAVESIKADLFELCKGEKEGRTSPAEITCFKSVGHALEDLAAAQLAFQKKMNGS